jgi:hypothetical protein
MKSEISRCNGCEVKCWHRLEDGVLVSGVGPVVGCKKVNFEVREDSR